VGDEDEGDVVTVAVLARWGVHQHLLPPTSPLPHNTSWLSPSSHSASVPERLPAIVAFHGPLLDVLFSCQGHMAAGSGARVPPSSRRRGGKGKDAIPQPSDQSRGEEPRFRLNVERAGDDEPLHATVGVGRYAGVHLVGLFRSTVPQREGAEERFA
jgi:hypothetical protein